MSNDKKKNQENSLAAPTVSALMYVGPAIKHPFPIARGTVFKDGLPDVLKKLTGRDPDLAVLFLPLKEAGKAMRQLEAGQGNLIKQAKAVAHKDAQGRK